VRGQAGAVGGDKFERALVALCFERGFRDLELADLLERAELDEAAFHTHYVDLEDCACQLFESLSEEFVGMVGAAISGRTGWRNQIRAAAYAMLRFWLSDLQRARFIMVEAVTAGERARLIRDQTMNAMVELIDLGRQELDEPSSLSRETAVAIAGTVHNRMERLVATGEPAAFKSMVPQLMYAVVLPYLGEEAALQELRIPPPRWVEEEEG
jgi:AcrR family transcriptional regulator